MSCRDDAWGAGGRCGVRRPRAAHRQAHRRWPHARAGHGADRRRRALGPLRRDEDAEGGGARVQQPPRAPARRRHHRRRPSTRWRPSTPTPAVDAMLVQYPGPPAGRLRRRAAWPSTRTRTSTGCTPRTSAGWPSASRARWPAPRRGSRRSSPTTRSRSPAATSSSSGAGVTIGRPLSILLSQKRATANAAVTVVHTGVADWAEHTRRADILVAAAGVPGMIQPEHVRPGGVVVGAGVRYAGPHAAAGRRRGVRGGRRLDHPPRRRGGAHHDRPALPQPRRGRRAPGRRRP